MPTLKEALQARRAAIPEKRLPTIAKTFNRPLTQSELSGVKPTTMKNTQSGQLIQLYEDAKVNPNVVVRAGRKTRRRKTRRTKRRHVRG